MSPILASPDARVLDLCCGTGDVLLALAGPRGVRTVLGSDFCHPMLVEAQRKIACTSDSRIRCLRPTRWRCRCAMARWT